jgi:hypothetical protein
MKIQEQPPFRKATSVEAAARRDLVIGFPLPRVMRRVKRYHRWEGRR